MFGISRTVLICVSLMLTSCLTRLNLKDYCPPPKEYKKKATPTIIKEARKFVRNYKGKKAVTFCVFGDREIYTKGVLENIEMVKDFYPNWDTVIFFDSKTVPQHIIDEAKERGAKVIVGPDLGHASSRFYVIDMDYDVFISRDADSRINWREVAAVADWLKHDWAILHAMHDTEKAKDPLLAGLWGGRVQGIREKIKAFRPDLDGTMKTLYEDFISKREEGYGQDQIFLKDVVLEAVGLDAFLTHESLICDAYPKSRGFPITRGMAQGYVGKTLNFD